MKVILHKIVQCFLTSHASPATKLSYSSLPTPFDMIEVLSSWPWATYTKAILCVSRLEERKNHTYYSDISHTYNQLHFSPRFSLVTSFPCTSTACTSFPALIKDYKFSRAFHRFQTFPRFLPFTTFPAFTDGHMFSRTFYLTRFYFEFWFANLAACKASLVLAQWFLWGNSNSNNSIPLSTFAHHRLLSRFFNSRKKRSVFFNRSILALWTKDNREQIFLAALKSPVHQQSQPQ